MHRELSERCDAWKLPLIEEVVRTLGLRKVTTHGCGVGLRTLDKSQLLCKGWTIATTQDGIVQHMNLRCQKNHKHGECRGANAAGSARYTAVFARKIVDCMLECEAWAHVVQSVKCARVQGEQGQPAKEETELSKHDRQPEAQQAGLTKASATATASADARDTAASTNTTSPRQKVVSQSGSEASDWKPEEHAFTNEGEPGEAAREEGEDLVMSVREERGERLRKRFFMSTV